jgi:carboxyl-terminal processing protease
MNRKVKILQIFIVIIIAFLGGYFFGVNKVTLDWHNYKPIITTVNKEPPSGIINIDFNPFWTVWQKLAEGYYDKTKLDQQKMLNGAISGMVNALGDPFTMYLPPVQNTNFKQGLAGQFSGIGAELTTKGSSIIVIAPLDGSPAEKVGVKSGDTIVKVDGQSTAGWDLAKTVGLIRGPKGTDVNITVIHKDTQKLVDLKITRDVITVKSVLMNISNAKCTGKNCSLVSKGDPCTTSDCVKYAYLRLSQFGDNTNQEWANLIKGINDQISKDKNIKGVVLDLRNNPGGYLTDAQYIASEFLSMGTKVVSEDTGTSQSQLNVERQGLLINTKVVVLINGGSASASEIVSGALRDNRKIELVGEKSFGKGTVQAAVDLGDGAGLHVTIAKWLTPDGTWVHGKGLTPDVTVALDPKDPARDTQLEKAVYELLK